MSLSIVIPTYTLNLDLKNMAMTCAKSYKCDELIITEDAGGYDRELRDIADTYIYNNRNGGFTVNVNRGWRQATGDFVAIVSSDTFLVSGDLKDLCIEGKVTSPAIENQNIEGLAGSFFVVHKSCPKFLNETMKTYYSDEEYKERTKDLFVKVPSVVIHHHQAKTVTVAGIEGDSYGDKIAYENLTH